MSKARRNIIFCILCVTCVALALLSTALNTALPAMIDHFGVTVSAGQWIVSGYALALAAVMPLTAFLVTRFPTRRLYLAALVVYLAMTVVCALCSSFVVMMCARVVQAAANGLIANLTQVTILSVFSADERGVRMGWFGLATGAAPVVAPTLGGLVVDAFGWQYVFWGIAVVLLASMVLSLAFMGDVLDTAPKRLDVASFVLSVVAFGGVTLGLSSVASIGIVAVRSWLPLAAGLVAGAVFVRRQLVAAEPFLELHILGNRPYRLAVLGSAALYFVMMGSAAVLPLYLQGQLGTSASVAGLVVLPGALLMALVSPVAGKVLDRLGIRVLAAAGGILLVASNLAMCVPVVAASLPAIVALTCARYLAVGCMLTPLMTWGNTAIEKSSMAHGTALLTSLRNVAGAIGVALLVGVLESFGVAVAYGFMVVVSLVVFLPLFRR